MLKSRFIKHEKTITALVIVVLLLGYVVYNGFRNRKLDSYVVGHIVSKHSQHNRSDKLKIAFQINGTQYHSYFAPSHDAFNTIQVGQLITVKYDRSNPVHNMAAPAIQDSTFYCDSTLRVGTVTAIEKFTKWNFIMDREILNEVYYTYVFNSMEYDGVMFFMSDTKVEVGTKYYVNIDISKPENGLLNLDKPYDEQAIINSILQQETYAPIEAGTSKTRDTVINGDTVQILDLRSQ